MKNWLLACIPVVSILGILLLTGLLMLIFGAAVGALIVMGIITIVFLVAMTWLLKLQLDVGDGMGKIKITIPPPKNKE